MDIPVKSAVLKGSELTLDVEAVRGSNKGTVNSSGSTTDCTWAREGQSFQHACPNALFAVFPCARLQ